MTLRQMLDFHPNKEDMALLPLEVETYIKVSLVSVHKDLNYDFIRFLFSQDILDDFDKVEKTIFYDFDATETLQERFVSIFELYAYEEYEKVKDLLLESIEDYQGDCDVIFDLYTHDDKLYRLSYIEEEIKFDEVKEKIVLKF